MMRHGDRHVPVRDAVAGDERERTGHEARPAPVGAAAAPLAQPSGLAGARPAVLLVGGIDPTGQAGLARDIAACHDERAIACPVATGHTIQTSRGFEGAYAVPASLLAAQMQAARWEQSPAAVKIGALFDAEQVGAVARAAERLRRPLVVDPVLAASAGQSFLDDAGVDALRQRLLPLATLVTPNEAEATRLTGEADPRDAARALVDAGAGSALVTRGAKRPDILLHAGAWHEIPARPVDGRHRGTGCRLATRIACRLARGQEIPAAVRAAHAALQQELAADADEQALLEPTGSRRLAHFQELDRSLAAILDALGGQHIPEVASNIAYALPGATDPRDVLGLAGRIAIAGDSTAVAGRLRFGGPHHTGRLAVVLQEIAPEARLVLNHRFDRRWITNARAAGLTDAAFRRADEPDDVPSTMEWGLREAVRAHRQATGDPRSWPDVVWDEGGVGKEAMIRVLARDPDDLVRKLASMHEPSSPPRAPAAGAQAAPRPSQSIHSATRAPGAGDGTDAAAGAGSRQPRAKP